MEDLLNQEDSVSKVSPNRDSLSQDYLKSLQSAIRSVTEQKDIPSAYKNLVDLLSNFTSHPDFDGYFQDSSTRTYFFEDFLPGIVSHITSLEEINRNEISDILNICLHKIMRLWSKFLYVDGTGSLAEKGWATSLNRLSDLLTYALKKDVLLLEDLQLLWKVIEENEAIQFALFDGFSRLKNTENTNLEDLLLVKAIEENEAGQVALFEGFSQSQNNSLKDAFLEYMFLRLSENAAKQMRAWDFGLLSRVIRVCTLSDQLLYRYIDLYLQILSRHTVSSDLSESFIKTLIKEKKLTENNKQQIIYNCTRNIEKEELTLVSLKVIRTLLESYPLIADNKNKLTRSEHICLLCEEQGLLSKAIKELKPRDQVKTDNKNPVFLWLKEKAKSEIIEFIAYITTQVPGSGRIITYEVLNSLWEMILVCENKKDWHEEIPKLFVQIIESINGIDIKPENLERLLNEDMNPERSSNILEITHEGFKCMRSALVALNESLKNISEVDLLCKDSNGVLSRFERLKISEDSRLEEEGDFHFQVDIAPKKIIGYKSLWELALRAENEKVAAKARDLLVNLHTNLNSELHLTIKEIRTDYLEQCFRYLKEETEHIRKLRSLNLIHAIIDEIDKDHLKRPKLHYELSKGPVLELTLTFDINSMPYQPYKLKVHSNMLVSDFISEIERLDILLHGICFEKKACPSMRPICELQNTRTLQSLGIKDQDELFTKIQSPPEAFLIQHDGTLNPKARDIFTGWFEYYSDNGKMSPEQCSAFVHSCCNDFCNPNDNRIENIFSEHDDDKGGYLTLENFLSFYLTQCRDSPALVWDNLYVHKRKLNLKLAKDTIKEELSASLHIISLINSNDNYIQLLFSLLESEDDIETVALELLNRLPTNPLIFADIVLLKGVRNISQNKNRYWSKILDRYNIYRFSYCLNVVEYLLDPGKLENDDNEDLKALWTQDPLLSEYKKTWTSDFLTVGGFEQLQYILNDLALLKPSKIVDLCLARIKYILSGLLKHQKIPMKTLALMAILSIWGVLLVTYRNFRGYLLLIVIWVFWQYG